MSNLTTRRRIFTGPDFLVDIRATGATARRQAR